MRIAVLHNDVKDDAGPDEQDNLVERDEVSRAMTALGHEVHALPCPLNLDEVVSSLEKIKPDLVFNLVESIEGSGRLIHFAASLLESLALKYTGCPADAFYMTSNKLLAKEMLRLNGVPTPAWVTAKAVREGRPIPPGKLIVKSVWEHASIGLDESSILEPTGSNIVLEELDRRAESLGGSSFAECFVEGREFNLSVLETEKGPLVLPPAEMCFDNFPQGKPRIVGYEAKWSPESFEYNNTVRRFDFPPEDRALVRRISEIALKCWEIFGLRGYARVDFRVDADNRPYVLEVNTNPCISSDAGFAAAAARHGLSFEQLVGKILDAAEGRPYVREKNHETRAQAPAGFRNYVTREDREPLEEIIRGTGFFNEGEVEVALELIDAFIEKGDKSEYSFLVSENNGAISGYSCFGRIPCTDSSWDLYWIVVRSDFQRRKLGSRLLEETEKNVAKMGGTKIYVDTSGRDLYKSTRLFYQRNGYVEEAFLKDFYTSGDGKFIFAKGLASD